MRLPLYVAGLAAGAAFEVVFTGGTALPYLIGAALVALLVGSAGAYRFVLLLPVAALYTLVAVYGRPPLGPSGWEALFRQIGQDAQEAAQLTYVNPVPYAAHPGLLVVLLPIIVIVVAFATSATLYEESPLISVAVLGLTIGFLSTVSFETGIGPYFTVFRVSAIALLLLASDRAERPKPAAVLAGALVVGLVLVLPNSSIAKEIFRPALIDWTRIGAAGTSRLSVEADVGDYLTRGRDEELLRIQSSEPLFWRGGTLDYFDGVRWSSTVEPGEDDGEEVSPEVETSSVVQKVRVLEAETNLLFGGYQIQSVSVPDAEARSDGSWSSARPLAEDSSYRVISQIPQPTTTQLQSAGTSYPGVVEAKFLQLPAGRPEVLRETAEKIRADYAPETPYEAARAIERYLISDGGFTYNLNVDYGRGDRALEEFLGDGRQGFCTQFATSMALISRELGVPSRVVYGATTGKEDEPDEYVVSGYNMHTWVEVYFPGVGWYPFDPTPGFPVPSTMQANAPRPELPDDLSYVSPEAPALQNQQSSAPDSAPEDAPPDTETASPDGRDYARALTYALPPILLLLLLAAIPLTKKTLVARGRPEDLYRDLTGRLRDLPGAGAKIADSPALTPTERLLLLAGAAGVEAGPFQNFARAYSESLYAQDPRPDTARTYRKALREYGRLPRWRRTLAAVNPVSLLLRARGRLVAYRKRLAKTLRGGVKWLRRRR
ncbi:hypothetical protein BH24ACT19_BH24ACT19_13830 [soil metagenome]